MNGHMYSNTKCMDISAATQPLHGDWEDDRSKGDNGVIILT